MAQITQIITIHDYNKMTDEQKAALSENNMLAVVQQDWQQVRIDAAIASMQGMIISDAYAGTEIANSYTGEKRHVKWDENKIAKAAVAHADALVAELQKKGGN